MFRRLLLLTVVMVMAITASAPARVACAEGGCTKYAWWQPSEEDQREPEEVCNDTWGTEEGCTLADATFKDASVMCRYSGSCESTCAGEAPVASVVPR